MNESLDAAPSYQPALLPPGSVSPSKEWGKVPGAPEVIRFLEGPQNRASELARAIRIFFEFMHGFRAARTHADPRGVQARFTMRVRPPQRRPLDP